MLSIKEAGPSELHHVSIHQIGTYANARTRGNETGGIPDTLRRHPKQEAENCIGADNECSSSSQMSTIRKLTIMPVSQAPDTPMKCDSCGAQLGTVGEATRALEKAKQSINEHLGEALADDSDLKME